jgi:hypothetical protein
MHTHTHTHTHTQTYIAICNSLYSTDTGENVQNVYCQSSSPVQLFFEMIFEWSAFHP